MVDRIIAIENPQRIIECCRDMLHQALKGVEGRPGVLVSGGRTYLSIYEQLGDVPADIFLVDERFVPETHPARTGAMVAREWLGRLGDPEAVFTPVPEASTPEGTAVAYASLLDTWSGTWTAALLGVGTDGHTASLFPGQRDTWMHATASAIAVEAELEPLVPRITTTPAFLKKVPVHIVVVTGEDKADIVRRWLIDGERLPISEVVPGRERIIICDTRATRDIPREMLEPY